MTEIQYGNWNNMPWQYFAEGMTRKMIGTEAKYANIAINKIHNNSAKKPHSHENQEQIIMILQGECDVYLDGSPYRMSTGSWIAIPEGVEHYMDVYDSPEPVINMNVFSPIREDYNESYREFIKDYRK